MKQSIFGTGLSGLVGSRLVELLSDHFNIESPQTLNFTITDKNTVLDAISHSKAEYIIHLAAITNVDECEKDKPNGKTGYVWQVNVEGTKNIMNAARQYGKKVIYVSTDFVFDGRQETYVETDTPHPINWYGITKWEGEQLVLNDPQHIIIRITYPYRAHCPDKKDFVHVMLDLLKTKPAIDAVTDHWFTPTFIDDIAPAIKVLIKNNESGVFHVVGGTSLTPFTAARLISESFGLDGNKVRPVLMEKFYKNRAPRPFKLVTKNDKITSLGVNMSTFEDGLKQMKEQGTTI